jgi:hypothetical protein
MDRVRVLFALLLTIIIGLHRGTAQASASCTLIDDFEDGAIDSGIWVVGGAGRGTFATDPPESGPWSHQEMEVTDPTDGFLELRVTGPTSGNTNGAESWARTVQDLNDGEFHFIDVTWGARVIDSHYNQYYLQITDGFIPFQADVHWPDRRPPLAPITDEDLAGTVDLLWRVEGPGTARGLRLPAGRTPAPMSIVIDPAGNVSLYDAAGGQGALLHQDVLDPAKPWHVRLLVSDAASSGFPGGDSTLDIYEVSECAPASFRLEQTNGHELRVLMTNRVCVKAGHVGLVFDPSFGQVAEVLSGADLPEADDRSLLVNVDAQNRCDPPENSLQGLSIGWINSQSEDVPIEPGEDIEVLRIRFDVACHVPIGTCFPISFVDCLGPVGSTLRTAVTACDDVDVVARVEAGTLCVESVRFRRGDANDANGRGLADAVFIFSYLFLGGETPTCVEAADADDSGIINIGDGVYLLGWLFLGGDAPPVPFLDCGTDPTPDGLGCLAYQSCADECL